MSTIIVPGLATGYFVSATLMIDGRIVHNPIGTSYASQNQAGSTKPAVYRLAQTRLDESIARIDRVTLGYQYVH